MRLKLISGLLALAVLVGWSSKVAAQDGLEGAWLLQSWTTDDGTVDASPGLILFTGTHYSVMFVNADEPRPSAGQDASAADVVAAYRGLTANAGRYVVDGNQFRTRAYVAKSPAYMAGFPDNEQTYTFEIDGETLHLTFGNGARATWTKVEGQAFPQG